MTDLPQQRPDLARFRPAVEALLHHLPDGSAYWSARDLQLFFEYATWQKFEPVIHKATDSLLKAGLNPDDHFIPTVKKVQIGSQAKRDVLDYRVSRLGCYHLAMMADPDKPQAAFGRLYFAAQTHAAEARQDLAPLEDQDPILQQLRILGDVRRGQLVLERRVDHQEQQLVQVQAALEHSPIRGPDLRRVHQLGQRLGKRLGNYSRGWRLFNDRFELASYRDLPAGRLDEAVEFLTLQLRSYGEQPEPLLGSAGGGDDP